MADIPFFKFLQKINSKKEDLPFTILFGFNEFLGENIIQAFVENFIEKKTEFNFRRYYFDSDNQNCWEEIISDANSSSFFIQSRKILVVMVRDEKKIKINKDDRNIIQNYLANPKSGTILILYVSLNLTKDEYKQIKKTKINSLLKELNSPSTSSVDLDKISVREVTQYIKEYLKNCGVTITASALERIIEIKSDDFISVLNQLPKFELAFNQEKSLDTEDIEEVVTGIESHSIWDLTEAIESENVGKYLDILKYLFINGVKPHFILGTLIAYYNKIFTAKFLLKHNFPVNDIGIVLQQPQFILHKFIDSVRHFSDKRLQQILEIIYDIDLELKTSGEESARLSLQNFIFQIKFLPPEK
jgi:DNA polymerase-3 subunit delta